MLYTHDIVRRSSIVKYVNRVFYAKTPVLVEKDTQVLIGEPANYPHSLVDAVKSYMPFYKRGLFFHNK